MQIWLLLFQDFREFFLFLLIFLGSKKAGGKVQLKLEAAEILKTTTAYHLH